MTLPPDEGRDPTGQSGAPGGQGGHNGPDRAEPPLDFDPYRFGRPDHPIAQEYAPAGYRQPVPASQQPYPYPSPPPPPPPRYAYGTPKTGNTKATIALVLGILAILFSWLSFFDLVLIVPAVVCGALGRGEAARSPARGGRSAATSGLVCGVVAIVLATASTIYIYEKVKPCLDKYSASSTAYQSCASDRILGN